MTSLVNPHLDQHAVRRPSTDAQAFHTALRGYAPTPVHRLDDVAELAGVAAVGIKDESDRLGLPAFKVLGASWAIERTLRARPDVRTLVAASAGNHGRAVAHVAAQRGLAAEIFLPARAAAARRVAIADEGARVVVVDGDYEHAVQCAAEAARAPRTAEIADVGPSASAHWVIDGYATLFAELREPWDVLLVPTGVGSLAAAAARHAAVRGSAVIAVEPDTAACLTASLAIGRPAAVATPGTAMAGLDCAEVSVAAWPDLVSGIAATIRVSDEQADAAMRDLHHRGLMIGECGAAALAALLLLTDPSAHRAVRSAVQLNGSSRVLLVATEGPTAPSTTPDRVARS